MDKKSEETFNGPKAQYLSDMEYGKSRFNDNNLLVIKHLEAESELNGNQGLIKLRKELVEKMSKRYYACL